MEIHCGFWPTLFNEGHGYRYKKFRKNRCGDIRVFWMLRFCCGCSGFWRVDPSQAEPKFAMTATVEPVRRPTFLLPWRLVALLLATLCITGGLAAVTVGPQYVPGAVSGLVLGFFGTVFGDRVKTVLAIASVAMASIASTFMPAWVSFYALAPAFSLLAGTELARFGTRVSVFAIMSWITLNSPAASTAELIPLILVFSATAVVGIAMVILLKAEGRIAPSEVERGYAIVHGCALAIGLVLAQLIASQFENANSHWIALLFAARALDPPGSHVAQARSRVSTAA